MIISDYISDVFTDFKGEHSLMLFSKGCNLNCPICYNKNRTSDNEWDALELIKQKLTSLHTAIVISGGEPAMQDLHRTCVKIKKLYPSLKLKVFTNGQYPDEVISCTGFVDTWSVDFKTLSNNDILGVFCPEYQANVIRTLQILTATDSKYMVRIWKHPKNTIEEQEQIIQIIKQINPNVEYELVTLMFAN